MATYELCFGFSFGTLLARCLCLSGSFSRDFSMIFPSRSILEIAALPA